MGLRDALLGKKKLAEPKDDRLFALTTAAVTLQVELGLTTAGVGAIAFKPQSSGEFRSAFDDVDQLVDAVAQQSGSTVERKSDEYGFDWLIVHDSELEDLVTTVHTVAAELTAKGFGPQLLGAAFRFCRRRSSRLLDLWLQARNLLAVRPVGGAAARQRDRARAQGEARERASDRAGPDAMARTVQRTHVAVALTALIGLSLLVHWLAARRFGGLWIMPDETIYAHRALRLYHEGSLPILGGQGAGYGLLYPVVAGLPLSLGSFATGDAWLKPLQALVVSLAAIPVFMYSRRLMPDGYALVAAALTLASPLLLYSGLVMTEVVFYPVAALALLSVARAVATGTLRDQSIALGLIVLAILTRTQAVAFIGVFAVAVVVDALLARDRTRLRSFWPVWVVLALGVVAGLARPGLLGAYSTTVQSGYPLGAGLRMTYDHLAYVVVAVGVLPAAALAVLLAEAIRGRERNAHARALLTVTASAVGILVVQVGFFAARFSHHLLGRDLAALPPLLFCVFALWLARGGPGRVVTAALTAFAVLAVAALAPWNDLSAVAALPDTFDLALLERLRPLSPTNVVTVGALVLLALFVLLPRRALFVLPVLVLALLTATSVVASNTISGLARDAARTTWSGRRATGSTGPRRATSPTSTTARS